jgi:ligand-binding sensor domain-containing protein
MIIIPFPEPIDIAVHPNGTVWVTSMLYGAFAYDGGDWVQYGPEEGLPDLEGTFVEVAPDGSVYIGTRLGVTRITPDNN